MPRIPESELERLKQEVSVQRLVESSGISLRKGGKDWLGKCPFHADNEASLVITPHKNLWHCFACQIGGGPIDWVMKTRGISFRHAVELLKADSSLAAGTVEPVKRSSVRSLAAPVALDADDQALLEQTVAYYHQRLKETPEALAYLKERGLDHPSLVDTFKLGVADRSLGLRLPDKKRKDGASIRERLQRVGLIRESGHEHFNGSLVVPIFDEAGQVVEMYGRKLLDKLRPGTPKHLYLPGPHAGVFNLAGIQEAGQRAPGAREVILCEALIDAMSFWCHGYTFVTSSYGVEGFTADILNAFKANGIERIFIAYDRDEAGERAALKLAERLIGEGLEVLQVQFPKDMDANAFVRQMKVPQQALSLVLQQAQWLGSGRAIAQLAEQTPSPAVVTKASARQAEPSALVEDDKTGELPDEVQLQMAGCVWRVRGWKKNTTPEAMRVNVQVRRSDGEVGAQPLGAGYFVDSLDLFAARSRASFIRAAAVELGLGEEAVKRELGAVLLKLESLQDELMAQARQPAAKAVPVLSAEEEAQALALLRAPNLMQRVVEDLHSLGVVGEDTNLLAAYLAAVSRKLDTPLAVLIQSTSAAGKSALMDAVLQLIPEEERIRYSAMTGQSLFYLGESNLQHKILAIAEEEGVRQAAYALKLLQSDGELTIASTAKDEVSGNLTTKQYSVKGPVMLMLTTTAIDIDEELLNRCLVLSVNETPEQTAAIHARQRHKQTLEGLLQHAGAEQVKQLHHNAQRLLSNVAVVNPYASSLSFIADKTRTRRDHMKYLSLIRAIALLHQHQREVKTVQHGGQSLSYIEVSKADIALANQLAHEVLGRTLDELPPQTRKLVGLIQTMVQAKAKAQCIPASQVRFTRREVRQATHWSDNQLKVHCARLSEMEYLLVHGGSRGHSLRYELLWDGVTQGQQRHLCGLIEPGALDAAVRPDELRLRRAQVGLKEAQVGAKLAPSCPQVGVKLGVQNGATSSASIGLEEALPLHIKKTRNKADAALVAGGVVAAGHGAGWES